MSYECAFAEGQGGHPVNWLITRLAPAMTISLCDEDFPVGLIPVLASELGVDPARLYDSIKRFMDREQARDAKAKAEAAEAIDQAERNELLPPECYEDGNTDYGREDAEQLAEMLDAEGEPTP